ncbi:hypothetical protein AB6A40_005833 [Gnathostoma spinigerum]|uniref:Palmitoyltransferase n=1 Tax=Gnathostoma spinigerum TaxID=75299 RepID=A0ABD6EGL9_9BILA
MQIDWQRWSKLFCYFFHSQRQKNSLTAKKGKGNWRRHNGWTWPPSGLQILSWFGLCILLPLNAFILVVLHPVYTLIVLTSAALWIVVLLIVLTTIDPAIPTLSRHSKPLIFDATKHEHVIENLYCNVCAIQVDATCKHCRQCNKCITGFDHHCEWLNNCIGSLNYRWFLITLISADAISLILATVLVALLTVSFVNIHLLPEYRLIIVDFNVWRCLCCASGLSYIAIAALSTHLLYFHFKLWKSGMTTYGFISYNGTKLTKKDSKTEAVAELNTISLKLSKSDTSSVPSLISMTKIL